MKVIVNPLLQKNLPEGRRCPQMGAEIIITALFGGTVLFLAGRSFEKKELKPSFFAVWAGLLLLSALALRLLWGYFSQGFTSDIDTFKAWAYALDRTGLSQIYGRSDLFLDYPPGYLYILLLSEKLRRLLDIPFDAASYTLLLKLPSLLADLICGALLLWLGKRKLGEKPALLLSAAYLFCPVALVNSARWGQVDSFCTAILFCSVLLLYKEWYVPSALLYGLSIACKPQMLIFAPMYLFFATKQRKWGKLGLGVLCTVGAVLLTALPFTEGFDFWWLLERYRSTMDYYNYYSVNAYNFWTLIGRNWHGLPEGIARQLLTLAAPVLATALCGLFLFRAKRKDAVFACPVLLMTVMYLFGIKMHERYLYPVFLFLLLCFLFTLDRRLLRAFALSGAAHYLNVAHVLYLFREKGGNYDPNAFLTRCLAGAQILALLYLLYTLAAAYLPGLAKAAAPRPVRRWSRPAPESGSFAKTDWFALIAVTTLYGLVAFWNLGSHETALTSWTPEENGSVIFQAESDCDAIYYLPGLAPDQDHYAARTGANIRVETSADGKIWTDCGSLSESGTYVFTWFRHTLTTPGRYIRLTAEDGSSVLNEIGLKVRGRNELSPLRELGTGGALLTDEQETVPFYTTYENSSYFDEIYHARTAYENILGLEPYENTHPPLGKYLISLGVRLFGMNPFGWRFMGTLFGVLMLPVLYHLLKQLFGKTYFCCIGTLLFAFDFMHFTQTRIATIDTYAVFFLLLMYDTMTVFLRRDLQRDSMKKLLPPLLLCGVFTGLGIASKWTAAYGAAGLAVLFFGKLILSFRDAGRAGENTAVLRRKSLSLCLWCCLFFLAIPFGLYFAAYLPLATLPHNRSHLWSCFCNYQVNMFRYHSQLVAEHYFASPWYEWPFDVRPIWYFSGDPANAQGKYSTIAAFGNPLLWWAGVPALACAALLWTRERKTFSAVVLCGFLSVYLPWVLVPRLTFIYHYFTAVPFFVIALTGTFSRLEDTRLGGRPILKTGTGTLSAAQVFSAVFTAGCLLLFAVYFPVISGAPTDKAYSDALRLFPTWYF